MLVRNHQRRALRRAVHTPCQAVAMEGFRLLGERTVDLSPRGMLVACHGAVEVGESVVVTFRAPRRGPWVDAEAEVSRVIRGYRVGDPGYCAGLRFTHMDRADRGELLARLAGYPPPVPKRRISVDYAETVRRIAAGA